MWQPKFFIRVHIVNHEHTRLRLRSSDLTVATHKNKTSRTLSYHLDQRETFADDTKCLRCRQRKTKCSGDPGDGSGCDTCKTAKASHSCVFIRPHEFFFSSDDMSHSSGSKSCSPDSRVDDMMTNELHQYTKSYHDQQSDDTLQLRQSSPSVQWDSANASVLPLPGAYPADPSTMTLLTSCSPHPAQQTLLQPITPSFADLGRYRSNIRILQQSNRDEYAVGRLSDLPPLRNDQERMVYRRADGSVLARRLAK